MDLHLAWRAQWIAVVVCACALACGGQTVDGGDGGSDAGSDHQQASDAEQVGDNILSPLCPASAPTAGTACSSGEGFQCEYGASFWAVCDAVFTCTGGAWQKNTTEACPFTENQTCPSSFSSITLGGDCAGATNNETCDYPQGTCVCEGFCGGFMQPDASPNDTWKCLSPTDTTCPWPRPRFGSACTGTASCQYDVCCAGSQMQCNSGTWQGTTEMGGCP